MTTTTATGTPDLTAYRCVHRALRVGASSLAEGATALPGADEARRRAYARYWRGYAGEVLAHHTIEDDFFFPALVERVAVAGDLITRTDADHHHLDDLMDAIGAAVDHVRRGDPAPELAVLTRELAEHMEEHLDFEDRDVLPLFERHFDAEEYEAVDAAAMKSLGIGRQAAFTVPFVVSTMTPEQVAKVLGGAPMPMRVLYRLTRGSHARLTERAFGRPLVGVA